LLVEQDGFEKADSKSDGFERDIGRIEKNMVYGREYVGTHLKWKIEDGF